MHTDTLFYRLFQERPATAFELAGLAVPADPAYRMHAEEVKQTAFRLDGVMLPDAERPDLPVVFTESQFYPDPQFDARWLASIFLLIDLIETIIVYKFPQLTRAGIQIMLHLPETDLKKARFYQEAYGKGKEIGERQRGATRRAARRAARRATRQ